MEQKKKKRHTTGQRILRNIRLVLSEFFHLIFSPNERKVFKWWQIYNFYFITFVADLYCENNYKIKKIFIRKFVYN